MTKPNTTPFEQASFSTTDTPDLPPRHIDCPLRCIPLAAGDSSEGPEQTGTAAQPAGGDEAGDPFDPDDGGPYQVHGLAIPENGLTFGKDERWTYWPEQVGRNAEGLLAGRNIVDLHPEEVTNDDVIGEVTGEQYIDGLGLAWAGELDSRKRAKQVHRGRLDSSPYLFAYDGGDGTNLPADAPDSTRVASRISKVRDIGMVPDGAIEGSEVSPGPHPDIKGESGVATALSKAFGDNSFENEGTFKPSANETDDMSDDGSGDGPSREELQSKLKEIREEKERLENENQILRKPYLEAVTEESDLEPEQVNMTAEDLAEYFSGESEEGTEGENGEGPSASGGEGDEGGEGATALSAAPLTAARGSPAGSGSATALSEGESGGSGGEVGSAEVETPDEPLEVLEERRRVMGSRGTDEYREELDSQIEAKKRAGGN